MPLPQSFTPQDEEHMVALVAKPIFDAMLASHMKDMGKEFEVEWGEATRGTITYYEPTIYEMHPKPDPLTVDGTE